MGDTARLALIGAAAGLGIGWLVTRREVCDYPGPRPKSHGVPFYGGDGCPEWPVVTSHSRGDEVVYEGRREVVRRVLSPQVAAATLSVLQGVVDRGTGRRCRLDSWTTFGKTGDEPSLAFCNNGNEDVNNDGLLDVVCHFYTQDTGFQFGDTEGILKGLTQWGGPLGGEDSVRILK